MCFLFFHPPSGPCTEKKVLDGFSNYGKVSAHGTIKNFADALAINPRDYEATYLLAQLYYDKRDVPYQSLLKIFLSERINSELHQ